MWLGAARLTTAPGIRFLGSLGSRADRRLGADGSGPPRLEAAPSEPSVAEVSRGQAESARSCGLGAAEGLRRAPSASRLGGNSSSESIRSFPKSLTPPVSGKSRCFPSAGVTGGAGPRGAGGGNAARRTRAPAKVSGRSRGFPNTARQRAVPERAEGCRAPVGRAAPERPEGARASVLPDCWRRPQRHV